MVKTKKMLGILLVLIMVQTACVQETPQKVISEEEIQRVLNEELEEPEQESNSAEGYTYVFQIGTDPIPVEIAELGGERYKEIYEDVTAIRIGLLEKEMEENPELKKRVDSFLEDTKDYLNETYGEEFEVIPVEHDEDYFTWTFIGKEKGKGEEFAIDYVDFGYKGKVMRDGRMEGIYGREMEEQFSVSVKQIMGENTEVRIFVTPDFPEKGEINYSECTFYIWIGSFIEKNIDKIEEQKKIIQLMDIFTPMWKGGSFILKIEYWPTEYKNIMQERVLGNFQDSYYEIRPDNVSIIKKHGLAEYFVYDYLLGEEETLIRQVSKYQEDGSFSTDIWEFWQ